MFRVLVGAVAGAVLGLGMTASAWAQVVTNPDWLERPNAALIAESYPHLAQALGIEGRALVSCEIDKEGLAQNCVVISESPAGLGFGGAMLAASKSFRFKPKTVDRKPVDGGTVRIPMRYHLPTNSHGPLPAPPQTPPALAALTDQLALNLEAELLAQAAAMAKEVETNTHDAGIDPATRAAYRAATTEAARRTAPGAAKALAALMAEEATEAQLRALVGYHGASGARAIALREADLARALGQVFEGLLFQIQAKARERLCGGGRCIAAPMDEPSGIDLPTPQWAATPTPGHIAAAMPQVANIYGVSGWARLNCIVTESGKPSFCVVAAESPGGFGLGRAASTLSDKFRLDQKAMEAGAQGRTVALVVEFPKSARGPSQPKASGPAPAPSGTLLALGRRLTETDIQAEAAVKGLDDGARQFRRAAGSEAELRAIDTLIAVVDSMKPAFIETVAVTYASIYTAQELETLIALQSSEVGDHLRARGAPLERALDATRAAYHQKLTNEARAIFCRAQACQ